MAFDDTPYDDLEWPTKIEATEQVVFGFDGELYEMTLCAKNAERFKSDMAPWVDCARQAGIKLNLPKSLRIEFPDDEEEDEEVSEPSTTVTPVDPPVSTERPSAKKSKPAPTRPLFDTGEKTENAGKVQLPENWWHTPPDADYQVRTVFKAARRQMWVDAGEDPQRGRVPPEHAANWARKHPDRARKLAAMHTS